MKRVRHLLRLLLAGGAILFPLTVSAQSSVDDQVITSTFDGAYVNYAPFELYCTGDMLTAENNTWSFTGGGSPWPNISSTGVNSETVAKLQLNGGKSFSISNAFGLNGLVKKIVVRAGGNLKSITLSGGFNFTALNASVTDGLQDYEAEFSTPWGVSGEGSLNIELEPASAASDAPVYLKSVTITIEECTVYDFFFCGTQVTSKNCDNIVVEGMTGKAIYDPALKALHLENVTYKGTGAYESSVVSTYSSGYPISVVSDVLNSIVLTGKNSFTHTSKGFVMDDITFKGVGTEGASLTCKGNYEMVSAASVEVIGCNVKFESQYDAAVSTSAVRMLEGGTLQCKTLKTGTPALQLWTEDITMATGMAVLPEGLSLQQITDNPSYGYCDESNTPATELYIGSPDSYSPSYTSTFVDFTSTGDYQGTLTAAEQRNWTVSTASILSGRNNIYYYDDKCIQLQFGSPDDITLTSQFPVTGKVRKVIITMGGNVNVADVIIGNEQRTTNQREAGEISDFVANFGSGIEVTDANVQIKFTAYTNLFIVGITIVTGEEEEQQTTSGTTGQLNWKIEDTGNVVYEYDNQTGQDVQKPAYRLTVSGDGYMPDYHQTGYDQVAYRELTDAPWSDFATITEVVIGEGVSNVASYALVGQKFLNSVTLPSTMEIIGQFAFMNSMLYNGINLPEGLLQIGDYAFAYTSMQSVTIPSTVELVSGLAFRGNNLRTLTVAEGNTTYDSRDNSNAVIVTADNKLYIGTVGTVIPATVTSIADYAFQNLYNLKTLVIPEQTTTIGKDVFLWTNQLTDVTCYAHPADLTWAASNNENNNFKINKGTKLHVRASELETWQSKFANLNVTFEADILEIAPVTAETTVNVEALSSEPTLEDTVVDEVYYNLDTTTGSGYDASEGCIVIAGTTDMEDISDINPGSTEVKDKYQGLILMVDAGKGAVYVNVKTMGSAQLAIQVGDSDPDVVTKNEKGIVAIGYDVDVPTYIYIYAVSNTAGARGRFAPAVANGIQIYDIQIKKTTSEVPMVITDAKYATFMAPFSVALPEGVTAFTVNSVADGQVTLTQVNTIDANTPVIIYSDNAVNTNVEGVSIAVEDTYTVGRLTGTYTAMTAPEGTYILQKVNGNVVFSLVNHATYTPQVAAYHAYLTAPVPSARTLSIGGSATGINVVEALNDASTTIYDANGVRLPRLKKGLNIMTTSGGKSVKVMVK